MIKIQPLTAQQVFDNALFGVRSQKKFSRRWMIGSPPCFCLYRFKGARCGLGWSISDAVYRESMDDDGSTSVEDLVRYYPRVRKLFSLLDLEFLSEIQNIHDTSDTMREFNIKMKGLTVRYSKKGYNLTYTKVK